MARQWRIEFPGALYHVLSRGNARQNIFTSDDDRYLFLALLEELSARFNLEIYAYVMMDNHYHLLLKTLDANLSKAMQWFGTSYTRKFNLKNHACGHLFQGRFKSIIVENDAYLLRVSCYIHGNPLRATIVKRLVDFPWSSYRYYAYTQKPPDWLETNTILDQVSGHGRHTAYRIKVQTYAEEKNSIWEDVKHGLIYGSQEYVSELKARFLEKTKDAELPQHNSLFREIDLDDLLDKASRKLGVNVEAARKAKRIGAEEKDGRDLLIYILWKTGRLSNSEIGTIFGLTYSAVSWCIKSFTDRVQVDQELNEKYNAIYSLFKV